MTVDEEFQVNLLACEMFQREVKAEEFSNLTEEKRVALKKIMQPTIDMFMARAKR